jgi:hypothetical protein
MLATLISYAYKVPFNQSPRMMGIPDWAGGPQGICDIEAKSAMPPGLSIQARNDRLRAMVQALLARLLPAKRRQAKRTRPA